MKAAIYTRASTEDQARDGYSLEVQKQFVQNFAKNNCLEIYNIYVDDRYSGYKLD